MSSEAVNLIKLIAFMAKIVDDGDGITFYDDGKRLTLQMNAADSLSVTATLTTTGGSIAPVTMRKADFLKAYRAGAKLSGTEGKLTMTLGNWRTTLLGSVETKPPVPFIVEGDRLVANVEPLKSVPTEDNYGGSTWAIFTPSGYAALCTTYSMVAIALGKDTKWPKRTIIMQANAIYPMLNLVEPKLSVSEDSVGIVGLYPTNKGDAEVVIALSKPNTAPPKLELVEAQLPGKRHTLSVSAKELRTCIEGARKIFDKDEATLLTFSLTSVGLAISVQTQQAALQEVVPYVKRPEDVSGKLVINTDVIVTAFKGLRELTTGKATACIKWDENVVSIRIVEDNEMVGAIVIAASSEV